jgi:predicted dehydrogenase
MMSRHANRREFLKSSALAGAGFWAAGACARAASRSPGEKLNVGIIGVHSRGAANMAAVAGENIVALCDVDDDYLAEAAKKYPQAKTYVDWRKMLDQKDIDAVTVSTTEHTHALASIMAMQRGKHVYCEKPLAHSVYEARMMRETCKQMKVATQMGTQIHATDNYRRVVELIQSGAIGPVREAHVWVDQGIVGPRSRPAETPPVPKNLHWDLWLGPAPWRPYHPCYFKDRSMSWQNWWDFGNGALGDMGSHTIDLPFWALELQYPATVEAEGPGPVRPETPRPRQTPARPAHLVRRPPAAEVARGRRLEPMAHGDHVRRRQGDLAGRLRQADLAAGGRFQRPHAAQAPHCAVARPSPGMDRSLQDGLADALQLRVFRYADRAQPAGHGRLPRRQEAPLGRGEPEG